MLPDGSGFDVLRELRRSSEVPVIMLTARGEETDRIVGLELGADDYVVKPFSAREVVARIRAVLRRTARVPGGPEGPIEIGGLRLDPARRTVSLAGDPLELARKEFELLPVLMANAGQVLPREPPPDEGRGRAAGHCWAARRWPKVRTLGSSGAAAFCLDFGVADTRAARERVEEAVLAVVPVPQPKKKED